MLRKVLLAGVVASGLLAAAGASAQQAGATIRGRVIDEQKAVLPGVSVIVTNQDTGTFRDTVTGSDGMFSVPGLTPGMYRVTAELAGFRRLTRADLELRLGTTAQLDLTMQVGGVEENVTVTGQAPQVDLTSPQVGGNVSATEISGLPSATRNFVGYVALLPGVQYNPTSDSSSDNVNINGQSGSGVVFTMDGGSNNDDLRGGSAGAQARTALEAIQEFQVVTNQFDAEYGTATAGVINAVTKQGTNSLHGSGFGYYTNPSMTAKDFFVEQQNLEKPDTNKRQWGATLGGPIVQDKVHFFLSFERLGLNEGRSRVYPSRPDKSFTAVQQTNSYNYLGRLDHQLDSNRNYSVRYLWDHQPNYDQVLGNGTKDTLAIERDNDMTLVGTYNWILGGRKLNTTRVQFVHEKPDRGSKLYQDTHDYTQAPPTLQYLSFYDQAGNQYADFRIMNTYALDEVFNWFVPSRHGSHDLKFGAQYTFDQHHREDQKFTNGQFDFVGDQDFDASNPSTYPEQLIVRVPAKSVVISKTHSIGLFGQDKWLVGDNLTLNLGVRYDVYISPVSERWNPFFSDPNAYPIDTNNIQPRLGFAYNMGGNAVVRGGFGMFYEKQWIDRFESYLTNTVYSDSFLATFPVDNVDPGPSHGQFPTDPMLVNGPVLNRNAITAAYPLGSLNRNTGAVYLDTPGRILPHQNEVTIGYERQLGPTMSFAADYVNMRGHNMPIRYDLNPAVRASTSRTAPITRVDFMDVAGQLGLSPFSSNLYTVQYVGDSQYDGLNLQLQKRLSNHWSGRVSYALGHARGNTDGTPTATNNFQVLADNNLELNQGPTIYDRRHTLSLSGLVEVPGVKGLTGSVIARIDSGRPFTIYNSNVDVDQNGILVDPVPAGTYSGKGDNAITVENAGGRNGAYGPGFAQVDLRFAYKARAGSDQRTVDIYVEVFNVTNRANFTNPTGDMRSGSFLVPTSLYGGGFPRQLQIGARFGF